MAVKKIKKLSNIIKIKIAKYEGLKKVNSSDYLVNCNLS